MFLQFYLNENGERVYTLKVRNIRDIYIKHVTFLFTASLSNIKPLKTRFDVILIRLVVEAIHTFHSFESLH